MQKIKNDFNQIKQSVLAGNEGLRFYNSLKFAQQQIDCNSGRTDANDIVFDVEFVRQFFLLNYLLNNNSTMKNLEFTENEFMWLLELVRNAEKEAKQNGDKKTASMARQILTEMELKV